MKCILVFALAALLLGGGCARTKELSKMDEFDRVAVKQLKGNIVSGGIVGRTVLSLNARRESRPAGKSTNSNVVFVTNNVVVYTTNITVSAYTNLSITLSTNVTPTPPQVVVVAKPSDEGATNAQSSDLTVAEAQTNSNTKVQLPLSSIVTNSSVTVANNLNQTVTLAPSQSAVAFNHLTSRATTDQIVVTTNNLTFTTQNMQTVNWETNSIVTAQTNLTISATTNVAVLDPQSFVHDDFLIVELATSYDFTIAPAESLVMLVDGNRYGFNATNTSALMVSPKGFVTAAYPMGPSMIQRIASAKNVRLRLRGLNNSIERKLPHSTQRHLGEFVKNLDQPAHSSTNSPVKKAALLTQ